MLYRVDKVLPCATGATTEGLPSGVLYRVRATYKYTREDVDEISFEVGEVINVVEYDDPEEQVSGELALNLLNMHHQLFLAWQCYQLLLHHIVYKLAILGALYYDKFTVAKSLWCRPKYTMN